MKIYNVDLYEYFSQEKPEGAAGVLTCMLQETSQEISYIRQCPAILVIPGGGYSFNSDREAEPIAMRYMAKGYCAFVLRYSVAPLYFPTQLREAVMAMRYIRMNCTELGVHPNQIAAIGFSAGGHLCGTLGTLYDCPEVADLAVGEQARPDGLVLSYAVLLDKPSTDEETMENISNGDKELRARLAVDKLVRPDMPPVYLWHTATDKEVPVGCSLRTALALEENKVPFSLHVYAKGCHGLSLGDKTVYPHGKVPPYSPGLTTWLDESASFLEEHGFGAVDDGRRVSGSKKKLV